MTQFENYILSVDSFKCATGDHTCCPNPGTILSADAVGDINLVLEIDEDNNGEIDPGVPELLTPMMLLTAEDLADQILD